MLNKLKDLKYHLHGFLSNNLKKFFNISEWQEDHPINILTTAILQKSQYKNMEIILQTHVNEWN